MKSKELYYTKYGLKKKHNIDVYDDVKKPEYKNQTKSEWHSG